MLPAVGTASYNGFTFNGSAYSKVSANLVYDEADRTVIGVIYQLSIRMIITESVLDGGTDTQVATLRQQLSKPGQALSFSLKGFGDFSVNGASSVKDVMWGPKPRVVRLAPLGSRAAWELEWVCEVCVPECSGALYQFGIMAFNFEASYSFDEHRYTTRTVGGYLEIPMTRVNGGRTVPDCADAYRERLKIPIPFGFRRTSETYTVSKDKRRLDFVFVDQELPSESMPEGCTDARGSFSVASTDRGLCQFAATIAASYVVAKGIPRRAAYDAFYALYLDRLTAFTSSRRRKGDLGGVPLVVSFRVDEGIYLDSRTMTFELSYLIPTSIPELFEDSGIWRAVPGTGAQQWQASLSNALGPRAMAGLSLTGNEDVIIDLCGQPQTATQRFAAVTREVNRNPQMATSAPEGLLEYQNELRTTQNPKMATYSPLPGSASLQTTRNPRYPKGSIGSLPLDSSQSPVPKVEDNAPDFLQKGDNAKLEQPVQYRAPDDFFIRMRGFAVTTWKPIRTPKMIRVGDAILKPHGMHEYTQRFVGIIGGSTPVYVTFWYQTYQVIPFKGRPFKAPTIRYRTVQEEKQRFLQMRPLGAWGTPSVDLTGVFGDG